MQDKLLEFSLDKVPSIREKANGDHLNVFDCKRTKLLFFFSIFKFFSYLTFQRFHNVTLSCQAVRGLAGLMPSQLAESALLVRVLPLACSKVRNRRGFFQSIYIYVYILYICLEFLHIHIYIYMYISISYDECCFYLTWCCPIS